MLHMIAPLKPFLERTAMAITVASVTSRGMMLPHVALPSRLKEASVTPVEVLGIISPESWNPRNAMNRPMPAGIACLTVFGIASKISFRRPVTVRRIKRMPSTKTNSNALA